MAPPSFPPVPPSSASNSGADTADSPSDQELLQGTARGEYEGFESLVGRYRDRVYRLAFTMTRNQGDAEEVTQETFLNLFRRAPQYRGESQVSTWIYRIAVNAALMRLRTRRRKPLASWEDQAAGSGGEAEDSIWPAAPWKRSPEDLVLDQELRGRIENAVAGLSEEYRTVLLLRDVEGMSNAETAESLGITVSAVKARLHRARVFVREELARYFEV